MKISVAALTHTGLVRAHNEDSIAVDSWLNQDDMREAALFELSLDKPRILIIADGMGGHQSGEIASFFVVEHLSALLQQLKHINQESIEAALTQTNSALYELINTNFGYQGMGSTLVGVAFSDETLHIFNVGDSRAFRLQDGFLEQLSIDDTPKYSGFGDGIPFKTGVITQAFGGYSVHTSIEPHFCSKSCQPGTTLLLCSDGLSDLVSLDALENAFEQQDLSATAKRMFDLAVNAGGYDNISIIVIRVDSD